MLLHNDAHFSGLLFAVFSTQALLLQLIVATIKPLRQWKFNLNTSL